MPVLMSLLVMSVGMGVMLLADDDTLIGLGGIVFVAGMAIFAMSFGVHP